MIYENFLRPLLFALDPELVHKQTIRLGSALSSWPVALGAIRSLYDTQFESLRTEVCGLDFQNPVGLAAGFDKHGELPQLIEALGFGCMEVGSVSLQVWPGNPSPTLLRLPRDGGLINRLGLNSVGADPVLERLRPLRLEMPLGVNLVKTADPQIDGDQAIQDYLGSFRKFYSLASFITLNLSCPNTAEGKTFEDPELLEPFLKELSGIRKDFENGGPVFIKLSPDLTDASLDEILKTSQDYGIDGFVIGNTTVRRETLRTSAKLLEDFGFGGLSGNPLKIYVKEMVQKVFERTGARVPVVALGGIGCDPTVHPAQEVREYLQFGASLVQIYTGLIYRGPSLLKQINSGLAAILEEEGYASLSQFIANRNCSLKREP